MSIKLKSKKQQGSFFAEIGAVIASIAILTLISTSYMDSMAGRAQVSEAFVLMNPIVENVNKFYAFHGVIGQQGNADTTTAVQGAEDGNYDVIDVYSNNTSGNNPFDFAGRYVKHVQSYKNGVIMAQMNPQRNDSYTSEELVGKISNVQTAIQGEYIFLVPFLIGDTDSSPLDPSEQTSLRWACLTTIDSNPPTGKTIAPLANDTINEQYFYAPGCVVITVAQGNCLVTGGDLDSNDGIASCATANQHTAPVNWNSTLLSLVNS